MKITMEGKWALSSKPREQIRVLCVDRPGESNNCVIAVCNEGTILYRRIDGTAAHSGSAIVPLLEKRKFWLIYNGKKRVVGNPREDKEMALEGLHTLRSFGHNPPYKLVEFEEVIDETF